MRCLNDAPRPVDPVEVVPAGRTFPEDAADICLGWGQGGAEITGLVRGRGTCEPDESKPGHPSLHPDQEVAVLLRLAPPWRRAVQRLQPPLPPAAVPGPVRGVLAAA